MKTIDDIENDPVWENDPLLSEKDLEVNDDDFESWASQGIDPSKVTDTQVRKKYADYLNRQ